MKIKSLDRHNTNSSKWDFISSEFEQKDLIPMWVADMDFQCASEVYASINNRAEHTIYGYSRACNSLHLSICNWLKKRFDFSVNVNNILLANSVMGIISAAIRVLTKTNDKILVLTPAYNGFKEYIELNQRIYVESELKYENGFYTIDYFNIEAHFKSGLKAIILCNPHNPVGRVWTKEELIKLLELCKSYDVKIIMDEAHSDFVYKHTHIPLASLSVYAKMNTITCYSPGKTFNISGLCIAYGVAQNHELYVQIEKELKISCSNKLNVFGIIALESAYSSASNWLDDVNKYINLNFNRLKSFFEMFIPSIKVIQNEGSYLVWLDCNKFQKTLYVDAFSFFTKYAKIAVLDGRDYGAGGDGFIRINIACSEELLTKALILIKNAYEDYEIIPKQPK
jgi:cysteine-S-conjugate beta-lyase